MNGFPVDAGGDELAEHIVGARAVARVGHRARVGDDAHIERFRDRARELALGREVAVQEIVHQLAGGTGLVCGVHHIALDVGLHMVVDEHLETLELGDAALEVLPRAVRRIHVNDKQHVRLLDDFARLGEVLLRHDDLVAALHPVQEVRECVGRDGRHIVSVIFKVMIQSQCASYSVAVRVEMEHDGDLFRML